MLPSGSELYQIRESKKGLPTLFVTAGGRDLPVHSSVDPSADAKIFTGRFSPEKYDLLVISGLGLGYHLHPLAESAHRFKKIIVIDTNPRGREMLDCVPGSKYLTAADNIFLLCGLEAHDLSAALEGLLNLSEAKGISLLEHPASVRIFSEYYAAVKKTVSRVIDKAGSELATLEKFGPVFFKNILANLKAAEKLMPVSALAGKFTGRAAAVVTPGPSLDKSIDTLKNARDYLCVIAVDSALGPLTASGIYPDISISIDPQPYIWEHHSGVDMTPMINIVSIASWPGALPRDGAYVSFNSHPVCQLIEELCPSGAGSVDSLTGSVAGDALKLAMLLGFDRAYMFGFDFSFIDYKIYARGTAYQNRYASFLNSRFTPPETRNLDYMMKSSRAFKSEGRFTRRAFIQYKEKIEILAAAEGASIFRNSSTAGLPVKGIPFEEAFRNEKLSRFSPGGSDPLHGLKAPTLAETIDFKLLRKALSDPEIAERLIHASGGGGQSIRRYKKMLKLYLEEK
jgi:hypothetical protein